MMTRRGGGGGVATAQALAVEYKGGVDVVPANAADDEDGEEDDDEDVDERQRQQGDERDSNGDGGVSRHWPWRSGRTSPRWPQRRSWHWRCAQG
jgi:hypothetical protein